MIDEGHVLFYFIDDRKGMPRTDLDFFGNMNADASLNVICEGPVDRMV